LQNTVAIPVEQSLAKLSLRLSFVPAAAIRVELTSAYLLKRENTLPPTTLISPETILTFSFEPIKNRSQIKPL